jgi:multicomponent Na+:H+ antiporter subunit G
MTVSAIISMVLILGGAFFALVAGLGVLRMQDVYIRMHASTKAGTLGVGMIAAGAAVATGGESVVKQVLVILFLLFTAPIGAHLIARAAFRARVPYTGMSECKITRDGFTAEDQDE